MSVPPPSTAPAAPQGFEWWSPFVALVGAISTAGMIAAVLGNDGPSVRLVATFIQDGLFVAFMVAIARWTGAAATPAAFGLRIVPWRAVALPAVLVFGVFYAFLYAWTRLDTSAKDDLLSDLGAKSSTGGLVATAILVCVVAPIVEELFFRGFLFAALRRIMSWPGAALAAGVVFGGLHVGTPIVFLMPLLVLGALLCVLYQRTGSLLPGMAVHAFNNALAFSVGLRWSAEGVVLALVLAPLVVVAIAGSLSE